MWWVDSQGFLAVGAEKSSSLGAGVERSSHTSWADRPPIWINNQQGRAHAWKWRIKWWCHVFQVSLKNLFHNVLLPFSWSVLFVFHMYWIGTLSPAPQVEADGFLPSYTVYSEGYVRRVFVFLTKQIRNFKCQVDRYVKSSSQVKEERWFKIYIYRNINRI